MRFILRLILNGLAVFLIAKYVPDFTVHKFGSAVLFSLVLGFVNATIGSLLKIVTLPFSIVSLGLFTLVINAVLFWATSFLFYDVKVESFTAAFWAAVILSVVSFFSGLALKK